MDQHLAIARKFRPQVFSDILGQRHVTRTLQNAIRLGRIHHAFLLTGARGVGKTSAARILARALCCAKGPAPDPCNECAPCREMLACSFPDVLEIDAASHNSVDDIRDLVEKARYTPQRGKYKVYIIDEVHMVTKQGFNALLKTLEEPPAHVIFILATTDPQKLLETVVSRCQRFDFKMLPVRTVYDGLKEIAAAEGVRLSDGALMSIAREGGGSMRDAQSLLDQVLSFSGEAVSDDEVAEILGFVDRATLYEVLEAVLRGDSKRALEALHRVRIYGHDARTFGNQLLEAVRNAMVVRAAPEAVALLDLPDDEIARLQGLCDGQELDSLRLRFDVLAEALDGIARSDQPMVLLEAAAVRMAAVRPYVPIDKLIARLEGIERRIGQAGVRAPSERPPRAVPSSFPPPERTAPTERPAQTPAAAPALQVAPPSPPAAPPAAPVAPRPLHPAAAAPPAPADPATASAPPPAPHASAASPGASPEASGPEPPDPRQNSMFGGSSTGSRLMAYKRGGSEPSATFAAPQPRAAQVPAEPPSAAPSSPSPARPEPAPEVPPRSAAQTSASAARPESAAQTPPRSSAHNSASGPRPADPSRPAALDPTRSDPPGTARCDGPGWRRFVHSLGADASLSALRGLLARSGFVSEKDGAITIGFLSTQTLRSVEAEIAHPALIRAVAARFGDGASILPIRDPDGRFGRTLHEEIERQRAAMRVAIDTAARADDAVQRTLAAFPEARIEEVLLPDLQEIEDVQ